MKPYTGWIIVVCFLAGLIGTFVILDKKTSGAPLDVSLATTTVSVATSTQAVAKINGSLASNASDEYKAYRNKDYGFSVDYPAQITPQEFPSRGDALTVLFQGADGEPGFQISVEPINGTEITPERFKLDEPSGVELDLHDTTVDGAPGITFVGFNADVGQTREIWFIHNDFLYEVTTYKELDSWLSDIMKTWRFI
jgi:PsbP-like protein